MNRTDAINQLGDIPVSVCEVVEYYSCYDLLLSISL
jgi:hypothetical protein